MSLSRRTTLLVIAGVCSPVTAQGVRRIGVLAPSTAARETVTLKPFFDQMAQLGWVEGGAVSYERSFANDQYHALPQLARDLVSRQPELIFAPPAPAAVAAKAATGTIPIVFATGTDPVGTGLVASLARPGGNVTGLCSVIDSLAPKALELLLQIMPGVRRIGLLGDRDDARLQQDREALAPLLAAHAMQLVVGEATHPKAFDEAVAMLLHERVEVIMTNSSLSFNMRDRLIERLRGRRVAVIGHRSEMVDAGGLFSYGAVLTDQIRRAALVVDKILRGARPADIPVEQPTLFEFAVNRRTAKALGITLSQQVLLRADRVVE